MKRVAIIGAGPAGLMAAEAALERGCRVALYDAMPTPARKFLMAGKSGLNITHSEDEALFRSRYTTSDGAPDGRLAAMVEAFGPAAILRWMEGLGAPPYVGTSGRVFPVGMKASPLLRAWLKRLSDGGAVLHARHRWTGWAESGALRFETPQDVSGGEALVEADATILALGGASWPRLGSDGSWTDLLAARGVEILPFAPSNCGFAVDWSPRLLAAHEGAPVKRVALSIEMVTDLPPSVSLRSTAPPAAGRVNTRPDNQRTPAVSRPVAGEQSTAADFPPPHAGEVAERSDAGGGTSASRGDFIITRTGIEGGAVYPLSAGLRREIEDRGAATLAVDLLPDIEEAALAARLAAASPKDSLGNRLRKAARLDAVKIALVHEAIKNGVAEDAEDAGHASSPSFRGRVGWGSGAAPKNDPAALARLIKALPLRLRGVGAIERAISTAGGVSWSALDERLMLKAVPGVYCVGEMVAWDAPTGGYLLTACLAMGRWVGGGEI